VSAGIATIMTELYRGFSQSFQANAGIITPLDEDRFLRKLSNSAAKNTILGLERLTALQSKLVKK
jgi:hypothetical protein